MTEGFMHGGEFWLPQEFLADDLFLDAPLPGRKLDPQTISTNYKSQSAVDPAVETDSDEEDYLAGLTRQMAHAFLQEEDDRSSLFFAPDRPYTKTRAMAGSPQSTLCDLGFWSGSNKGSPTGPSLGPSPPSTPLEQRRRDAGDLLSAAAGEVARMKQMQALHGLGPAETVVQRRGDASDLLSAAAGEVARMKQMQALHGLGLLGFRAQQSPQTRGTQKQRPAAAAAFYEAPPVFTQQQLQAERFYQLRQQQLMKERVSAAWRRQQKRGGEGYGEVRAGRGGIDLQMSSWSHVHDQPQLQQLRQGSGMRAVFLGSNGTRKESIGTGVFIPRRQVNPITEQRKKPACSTVLKPVELGHYRQSPRGYLPVHHNNTVARGVAGSLSGNNQKRGHYGNTPLPAAMPGHEVRLPVDWTY